MEYKIPCSWEVYGCAMIEAESLEEAIKTAEDDEFPLSRIDDPQYVDASFEVNKEMTEFFAEQDQFEEEVR